MKKKEGSMNEIGCLEIGHSSVKEKDFSIKCEVVKDEQVEVAFSHRHFFYAIYWIHEGEGVHVIDFEEYAIKPDRIFFIKPEQVHFLSGRMNMKYSALQFTENFMMPFLGNTPQNIPVCRDLSQSEKCRITTLFQQIQTEYASCLPNSFRLIQSEIYTLLLELERMSLPVSSTSIVPDILNKYKVLIERLFTEEHQVQKYAALLGVTPNYLNVLTRKHWGKSALDLINDRVILEVKRLLLRTDYDISEIAYRVGFNELSYFSRFFKRNTGMTPLQFRNAMHEMYQK